MKVEVKSAPRYLASARAATGAFTQFYFLTKQQLIPAPVTAHSIFQTLTRNENVFGSSFINLPCCYVAKAYS